VGGGGCFAVTITTSAGLAPDGSQHGEGDATSFNYPPEFETFFRQLTITRNEALTVQLPPGWQSLGAAASSDRYTMRFVADGLEIPALSGLPEFQLDQRPKTGVGVFLADPRATNPRPTTMSGRPAWLITGDGGWITLVFDHDGTAVSLGARGMTDEQLVAFAATLVPQPWSETLALVDARGTTPPPVEEQLPEGLAPLPEYCDVSLELG
jgi:hypothetical protein